MQGCLPGMRSISALARPLGIGAESLDPGALERWGLPFFQGPPAPQVGEVASLRGGPCGPVVASPKSQPQSRSVGRHELSPWAQSPNRPQSSWLPSPPISQALSFSHRTPGEPASRGAQRSRQAFFFSCKPVPGPTLLDLDEDTARAWRWRPYRSRFCHVKCSVASGPPFRPLRDAAEWGNKNRQHRRDSECCVEAVWTTHCWRRAPGNSA